jgi:hypothetical protein
VRVIGPYADAGAKQKAVYLTEAQRRNHGERSEILEARDRAIAQSPKSPTRLAGEHDLTTRSIRRIRQRARQR